MKNEKKSKRKLVQLAKTKYDFQEKHPMLFFLSGGLVNVLLESFVMNLLHAAIYFLTKD
jgi:hypothetical protein